MWEHLQGGRWCTQCESASVFLAFFFSLKWGGGKEVYKRRRLKGEKERRDALAGRKTSFHGEYSCPVLRLETALEDVLG